jgi:5-methylcytosine-specific restriction enzyme subunit McrC
MPEIVLTYEHSRLCALTEDELIALIKDRPKLIEEIDLKNKFACTSYFIGLQYLANTGKVLYVRPKVDKHTLPTNYLQMVAFCLQHPEVYLETVELFAVDFKAVPVLMDQEADLITPLIFVQFLNAVRKLVKGGLRKSYYRVEHNIRASVKGKVMVGKTIKKNIFQNRSLQSFCQYEEFGVNNPENRLLKKALNFTGRYSKVLQKNTLDFSAAMNYIMPAFEQVSDDVREDKIKGVVANPFFKDYNYAIFLAKIILKRFGYNINSVTSSSKQLVPPFWIDMSKLFELYVLGKLKEHLDFAGVIFQVHGNHGYVDFLNTTPGNEWIIDAKYKQRYKWNCYDIADIRQLSGYARDKGVLEKLSGAHPIIKCLIIYPDQDAGSDINDGDLFKRPIQQFEQFYRMGIRLPTMIP